MVIILLQVIETLEAMSFAMRLIKAFYSDEKNKLFVEQINSFIKSVDRYVEDNCLSYALFSIGALFEEAHIKYINEIDLSEPLSKENKSELINRLRKFNNEISSKRLEIQRGGARKRKGFVWTDEYKIKFYETVENLPKIGNKPMWEYALNELMEKDFDFFIKEYLKTKTPFKSVPRKLFNEAIKTWGKYKDQLIDIKPQEKPRAFEFRHALHLLKYPEITYSTAEKYFGEGKKLAKPGK